MILLTGTSDLVKVVTGTAGAIDVHASYFDVTGTPQVATPLSTNTAQITSATTTTVVGSPAASTQRNVKFMSVYNSSTTSANTVKVQKFDGSLNTPVYSYTLQPGDAIHYNDNTGWEYLPSTNTVQVPGRLLQTTVLVSGTTFTTGHFTNSARVRSVGGGGGGAGCTSVAADASAGGGGGAGGYCEKLIAVAPDTSYTYAIGTAGAGNSGAGGGSGGDTTITIGPTGGTVLLTAKGGAGAVVATAVSTLSVYAGGTGGVVGTNGDINASGAPGEPGIVLLVATPVVGSGNGGSGPFGAGGLGLAAVGNGNAGTGNGSGGGGAATGAAAVRTGGAGTVGLIQIDEYA